MSGAVPVRRIAGPFVLAALIVFLVAFTGCGGDGDSGSGSGSTGSAEPKAGGTLRVSQGEEVVTLDALKAFDGFSVNVVSQITETLFRVTASGNNEPWLVTEVEKSPDQKVWTLQLREGVSFSDGKPMTAGDVVFTLDRAREDEAWGGTLEGITKVEAPSPETVVITNSKPAPELEAILSQWSFGIVPKDFGGASEKAFAQQPVGTGPFVLGPWKRGESLTLEKNPSYWDEGQPYLDKIVFQTVPDANSRVAQLKGGQLDVIYQPPWALIDSIESSPELEVGDYPTGFATFLILNSEDDPFSDLRAREAASLALDREGIASAASAGLGEPSGSWFAPTVPYYDESIETPARDTAQAESLLSEAVADGADPSFAFTVVTENPFWGTAAQIVQQNLEEVGFEVELKPVDFASEEELVSGGEYQAASGELYDAIPSPIEPVGFYNGLEGLWTRCPTEQTTKVTNEAASEVDEQRREDLYHRFQQILDENKCLVPIVYLPFAWAHQTGVTGFQVGNTGTPWFAETGFAE